MTFKRFFGFIFLLAIIAAVAYGSYSYGNRTLNFNISIPMMGTATSTEFTYSEQPSFSDPNFFASVKQRFIDGKTDFIEADLTTMKLQVYKDGVSTLEVPIVTKGRPGSWWETPAGLYKVGTKEKAHFSGMGHVWMPWSLSFQGNFFIHGRTYHNDGTLSSKAFTGGCIRLDTDDAKKVYDIVDVGTPVLVFEQNFDKDSFAYAPDVPAVSAPIYLSADLRNAHAFASKGVTPDQVKAVVSYIRSQQK